jgi:hypothetical protein
MNEPTLEAPALDLDGLIAEAHKGPDIDWTLIEESIKKLNPGEDYVVWATNIGLEDPNQDVRDLAATILNISAYPFEPERTERLIEKMANEEYNIVKYRLAIALCQRDVEHIGVLHVMAEAMMNPDVGDLAREVWNEKKAKENEQTEKTV